MHGGAKFVAHRILATDAQAPGHFVRAYLGNQGAAGRVYAGVVAARVKSQHVDVIGEQRMIDRIRPVAIEAVNSLDIQMHHHGGIEAFYIVVQVIGIICQRFAAEPDPFLEHRVVERGQAVGLRGRVPLVHADPVHVWQSEATFNGFFCRISLAQEIVECLDAARAAARLRLGLEHDVVERYLVRVQVFHADPQDAFQIFPIGRLVGTGVMPESLHAVRDPAVVLVALFPVPGFGNFVIHGFGEHGAGHVQGHLHA